MEGFSPSKVVELDEGQICEWMHGILRAWAQGVTEYQREPYTPEISHDLRTIASTSWNTYLQGELERQREIVERNKLWLERAWTALRELRISSVLVEFSGDHDFGQIDDIEPEFGNMDVVPGGERA